MDVSLAAVELEEDTGDRDEVRYLGRLLGDTVREQEGVRTFELIETIRRLALRFRRERDIEAQRELETLLTG